MKNGCRSDYCGRGGSKVSTATPSIFNDVIGPVMRGPSSSHCAASVRIGRLALDLMEAKIQKVLIEFDPQGSLASTHQGQGSDMGLFGGFLGWDAADDRLVNSEEAIKKANIEIDFNIKDYNDSHPNTYRLTLTNSSVRHHMIALSVGGGMIEVIEIDGFNVSIKGDQFEALIYLEKDEQNLVSDLLSSCPNLEQIHPYQTNAASQGFYQVSLSQAMATDYLETLRKIPAVSNVILLAPVLPVLSRNSLQLPFTTCDEMLSFLSQDNQMIAPEKSLWELALHYEATRGDISKDEVFEKMRGILRIMKTSIELGLGGTTFGDRILGYQSGAFLSAMEQGKLLEGGLVNHFIAYATAMMEVKSSMGVIVAAPTAGSCATVPAVVVGAMDVMELDEDTAVKGLLAAGMIGIFVTIHATFAAEVGGCQAETGAAAGMAAAALVSMMGADAKAATDAASMALQNSLGLICDPVANRVEVPCLGKNITAAANAFSSANMVLAGFNAVIPLDEVINTMDQVGKALPSELRCTGKGGLAITATSLAIQVQLERQKSL
jgi:L-serine dehydratase